MSGVQTVIELLTADATVMAMLGDGVPVAGTLSQNTKLPALSVEAVSENDNPVLRRGTTRLVRERVQVTAFADDYETVHDLTKAAKRACADKYPDVAGLAGVAVLSAGGGPDGWHAVVNAPSKSHDFMVAYSEAADNA